MTDKKAACQPYVQQILNEARPIDPAVNCPVVLYLKRRGLSVDRLPTGILHHSGLKYLDQKEDLGTFPAMVVAVRGPSGIVAAHRTYLTVDGQKAPVPSPKKFLGEVKSCGAWFGTPSDTIAVTEGIETALAVHQATGLYTVAALSAGGMENLQLPQGVRRIHIFPDHDPSLVGARAAERLVQRLENGGQQ